MINLNTTLKNYISGNISRDIILDYKNLDYINKPNDTLHMAANLGKENRYTMQVTGIVL
jgi:hypothetical protein